MFLFFLFIYLAVLGLHFRARASSSCGKRGPLFIAVRGPLTIAASPIAEHRLQTRRLSNCGSRAQPLRGMWDPSRPGLEPACPAPAGRLSTTAPPGKPRFSFMRYSFESSYHFHACYLPFVEVLPKTCLQSPGVLWPARRRCRLLTHNHGSSTSLEAAGVRGKVLAAFSHCWPWLILQPTEKSRFPPSVLAVKLCLTHSVCVGVLLGP